MAVSPDKQKSVTEMAVPLRAQLGLGSAATRNSSEFANASQGEKADTAVQQINSKTGPNVTLTKSDVGLSQVDNTRDVDKPISNLVQSALDAINTSLGQKATSAQGAKADAAVLFTAQTLSDPQKLQVLDNIGALSRVKGGKMEADVDFGIFGITDALRGLPSFLIGATMSNNTSTPNTHIDVEAFQTRGNGKFAISSSTITKRIDQPWAAGTGAGGLDNGTVAQDTWYHAYIIRNIVDRQISDILFSVSKTPAVPAGYELILRIGAFKTFATSTLIRPFLQEGNVFYRKDSEEIVDIGRFTSATGVVNGVVYTLKNAPSNTRVEAILYVVQTSTNANNALSISPIGISRATPFRSSLYVASDFNMSKDGRVQTNGQTQVRVTQDAIAGSGITEVHVQGWVEITIPRIG